MEAKRVAKQLKMTGYNSEVRAQQAVCVRLSNFYIIYSYMVLFRSSLEIKYIT
jgi:hypothetical protein